MPFLDPQQKAFPTPQEVAATTPLAPPKPEPPMSFDNEIEEMVEMDEAMRRTIKANKYMEAAQMQLFGDNEEPEAYEVEKEIQEFAKGQLHKFLGMSADKLPSVPTKNQPVAVKLPFTQQQIEVLGAWADNLIKRPGFINGLATPQRGRPQEEAVKPAPTLEPVITPAPQSQVVTQPTRGRGRPRGTQAATLQKTQPQQSTPVTPVNVPKKLPNGAILDPETGRYFLEVETIDSKGNTKMMRVDVQAQASAEGVQPAKWPDGHSPLENTSPLNTIRVSQGLEGSASGQIQRGTLDAAIQHFSR
jgi:hypothetical protein